MQIDWANNACVVCGDKNPHGLRQHFEWDDGMMRAHPVVGAEWQGFDGLVHGGIITGLMDDAMWHAIYHQFGVTSLTAALSVRFLHPVPTGVPLAVMGWAESARSRLILAHAEIREPDAGKKLAAAEGRFMTPRD